MDRTILAFDPRRVPLYRFDVLVIGGGGGGSSAALAAAERGANVAVLAKGALAESNTAYAQGGVAAVFDPVDSFEAHVADTLRVGCGMCDEEVVDRVVRAGPGAIERLLAYGADFDRKADGSLELLREGGHSRARILHAGDSTGVEVQKVVTRAVSDHERIASFANCFVIDLLTEDGAVVGALARTEGGLVAFAASQVVLATGGAGQIYRETTNPEIATGDGIALGLRAGAVVRDMEFFQFHPTCLYIAGAARVLISEIVRGAGGVLRDRRGERFMPGYHPDAELAPRDVVSRAAFERMVDLGDTSVNLDLSEIEGDPHKLFPGIGRICRFFGIDIAKDPVPVRPGAHYMIGGLKIDGDGRTNVPGLWAVGECSSSGLHGANRMGSNSILECLVLGGWAGGLCAEESLRRAPSTHPPASGQEPKATPSGIRVNIEDLTYSLKSLMWRQMGVKRTGEDIAEALESISFWTRAVCHVAPPKPRAWELVNMLTVARLASQCALAREESRGVHYRTDFPEARDEWRGHLEVTPEFEAGRISDLKIQRVDTPSTTHSSPKG